MNLLLQGNQVVPYIKKQLDRYNDKKSLGNQPYSDMKETEEMRDLILIVSGGLCFFIYLMLTIFMADRKKLENRLEKSKESQHLVKNCIFEENY